MMPLSSLNKHPGENHLTFQLAYFPLMDTSLVR